MPSQPAPIQRNRHVTKPVVLIAEELSPATVDALGPDFEVRIVDGTDRPALLAALSDSDAILVRSATKGGAKVVASDRYVTSARAQQLGVQLVTLDELLGQSDFITIHMPKTPETTGMISDAQLALMKPTAFIVNVARGGLIDEDALHRALTNNMIAGAGLDVFVSEPPSDSPLLSLEN